MDLLSSYGKCQYSYKGSGNLFIGQGEGTPISCRFTAGQMNNGTIVLLCHEIDRMHENFINFIKVIRFEGRTDEGFLIKTNKKFLLRVISYLPNKSNESEKTDIALSVSELTIEYHKDEFVQIHFGVTNFKFNENDKFGNNKEIEHLSLDSPYGIIEVFFNKIEQYEKIFNTLSTLRGIDVTCKTILEFSPPIKVSSLIEVMDDICYLVSLKEGTKVAWIYYELFNAEGVCISRTHGAKIVKDYHPLDIFYLSGKEKIKTEDFLKRTYHCYLENRDSLKLNKGTIDTYLDAKAEHDFLEIRAAKISIAIEKLKYVYLKSRNGSEYIIPPDTFFQYIDQIECCIKDILKKDCTLKKKIQMLINIDKISALNRRSFSNILKELSREFHTNLSNEEISLFVSCRNSLVHRGDFYFRTAESEERKRCEPLPSIFFEYFFLINMLDRIFLRVVGYEDTLIKVNWRKPPEKILNWLS